MTTHIITYRPLAISEIPDLIDFDNVYLKDVMENMGIPHQQLPPSLTIDEVKESLAKKNDVEWIFFNDVLAGYLWLEKQNDCIYIAGVAIKPKFYGIGLIQNVLNTAEQKAKKNNLPACRLAAIPINGRAVNAYLKYGYKIISCVEALFGVEYPESFRFIMEKSLLSKGTGPFTEEYEICCSDYKKLKQATDNAYIGIRLIGSKNQNNLENTICFVK
ncbi:MAG: GNAT family N-acetyltransferase [Gammaproteobacteria bacterium]